MKILINAFSARQGGGQTYLINLLRHVPADFSAKIVVLAPASLELPQVPQVERLNIRWPVENPYLRSVWERLLLPRLLRKLRADVLFCPGGVVSTRPPEGCATVTMFRNMIPFDMVQRKKYPLGPKRFRNWLLNRVMLKSMENADLVIFISNFARSVIDRVARKPVTGVVIPHGINPRFRRPLGSGLPRPNWLPDEDYFLYVSTLDVYKAQLEVVQGFALLKKRSGLPQKLLLVGPENPEYGALVRKEIQAQGMANEIIVLGAIPYNDMPAVYQHAAVNVFASESENCPNILLEALAAGRPILCSAISPMPEFAADAAVYFDPRKPEELATQLESMLKDEHMLETLSRRAEERSRHYDWKVAATGTWQAIGQLHKTEAARVSA